MLTFRDIKAAIIASLSRDLLSTEWRKRVSPDSPPMAGHCAAASEAFYYLSGGRNAGMLPVVCAYYRDSSGRKYFAGETPPPGAERSSHWWIAGPSGARRGAGKIHDVTEGQLTEPFEYERGRGCGFQNPKGAVPSRRAQVIIDRVENILGKHAVAGFRGLHISAYQSACRAAAMSALRP
jgi:hypothetical protein